MVSTSDEAPHFFLRHRTGTGFFSECGTAPANRTGTGTGSGTGTG